MSGLFETYFEVPTVPVAKGRGRLFTIAGRPREFTPKKTREAEATFAALAAPYRPPEPISGPVVLALEFIFVVPKSWPEWQREAALADVALVGHTARPDLDNLVKLAKDSLTAGGWWRDDAQVVDTHAGKRYGTAPATKVRVRELVEVASAAAWKELRDRQAEIPLGERELNQEAMVRAFGDPAPRLWREEAS